MRLVPTNTQPLVALGTVRLVRLLRMTISATTFYFSDSQIFSGIPIGAGASNKDGYSYLPYLDINTGTRYTLSLSDGTSCKITLDNVDLSTAAFLRANRDNLQGSSAALVNYYLESGDELVLQSGSITDCVTDDNRAVMTISGFDPNTIQIPTRIYSQRCTWKYKGIGCPSASGLPTCDKLFPSCVVRIATQGFNGVLTITDTLSAVVQGSSAPVSSGNTPIGGGFDGSPDPRLLLPYLP